MSLKKLGFSISRSYYADHVTERKTLGQTLIESLPKLTLIVFIVATLFTLRQQQQLAESHLRIEWEKEVTRIESKINTQLFIYQNEIYHFRNLSALSDTMTCSFWKNYIEALDIVNLYPGITRIGFAAYVPQKMEINIPRDRSIQPVCLDDYFFRELLKKQGKKAFESTLIKSQKTKVFIYTIPKNTVKNKADKFNYDKNNLYDALLVLPIYSYPITNNLNNLSQTSENFLGWVYATVDIQEIINAVIKPSLSGTSLEIYQIDSEMKIILYKYKPEEKLSQVYSAYQYRRRKEIPQIIERQIAVANHIWNLKFIQSPTFQPQSNQQEKLIVAISGLLVSLFLFCLTAVVVTTRKKALEMNEKLQEEISKRRKFEIALAREKELAQVTLHSIGDGVITTDAKGKIQALNFVAENITGWTNEEAKNRPLMEVFNLINETTKLPIDDPVAQALKTGKIINIAENTLLINRSGNPIPIEDSVAPIRRSDNEIIGAVLVFRDVTSLRRAQEQLSWQAHHDTLTKLPNRRNFEKCLQMALQCSKNTGEEHTLCYLDLDRFKQINDTCGHAAGDIVLCQITSLIQSHIRKTDTLARLGGDEFALLLYQCTLHDALRVCNVILSEVKNYRFVSENKIFTLGVSMGLTVINSETEQDFTRIVCAADRACYAAKQAGRNCIFIYQNSSCNVSLIEGI